MQAWPDPNVKQRYVDWEEIRDQDAVVHSHLCSKALDRHPDLAANMVTIVRNPRNAVVSAAHLWAQGSLIRLLHGCVVQRGYVEWVKGVAALARQTSFVRYEDQTHETCPGWVQSDTDWTKAWNSEIEAIWVALGMAEMERSLGYNLANG